MNWIVAGLVTAVVAFFLDWILWSKVFGNWIAQYTAHTPETARAAMGAMMAKSAAVTLVFGLLFAFVYARFRDVLWAGGIKGGMEFGTTLWLTTIAVATVGNGIWLDKARPLLKANFWAWFIKLNAAGIVVALLLR